jgi:RHS repeat-associated protein
VQNALLGLTVSTYDANHNLANLEDANGHTTTFGYDACDRLSSLTDPLGRTTSYGYDPVGNLSSITFPNGNQSSFTYTDSSLLAGTSHSSDATSYAYSYNPTRTLAQVERNDGSTWSFSYDAAGRLIQESDENNGALGPFVIGRSYDAASNVTALDLGGLVSLGFTYDARDQAASLSDPGGTTTFTHDPGGRLTQIATPEGSTRAISYDAAGRPTQVTNTTTSGVQTFAYTYDPNGNVLTQNDAEFTYDALDRLTSWYDPARNATTTYAYDPVGNLIQVQEEIGGTVITRSFTYNAGDEITNAGFAYDANGNLTSDGSCTFLYDADNQLIGVQEGGVTLAAMTYDSAGRRTSVTTAAGTTYFHYLCGLLVAESNESGTIVATYAYAGGGLVSMTRGGSTYYYQTNAHGDVVSLTDSTGAVVNSYSYDPWGVVLTARETVPNPFRYGGYYYDSTTGLYYLWHRYYDPSTTRFLTLDPARLLTGDRYSYCGQNPLAQVDPSGLSWYHLFVPWSDQNPLFQDAYENGASWVHSLNPIYVAINGYYNEVQAALKGCSWSDSFSYGLEGVAGVVGTVTLFMPLGEVTSAGRSSASGGGTLEDILAQAAAQYPLKTGTEWHHLTPLYVGGSRNGAQVLLPSSYHQLITNEWREAVAYGSGPLTAAKTAQLSADFPGKRELVDQAKGALAETLDADGSIALHPAVDATAAQVVGRIPVEAEFEDLDGATVHVLLHVVRGFLNELEVYRDDLGPVQGGVRPASFRLVVL